MWHVRVVRLANEQVLNGDFREVEKWFIEQTERRDLLRSYCDMRNRYSGIYGVTETLTTFRP